MDILSPLIEKAENEFSLLGLFHGLQDCFRFPEACHISKTINRKFSQHSENDMSSSYVQRGSGRSPLKGW